MAAMPLSWNLHAAEGVGREERHSVLVDAAGQEHGARTTAAATASAATPARSVRPARAIRQTTRSDACSRPRRSRCTIARWCGGWFRRTTAARRRDRRRRRRVHRDRPDDPVEYRARLFVLAAGYCWSPHLLLAVGVEPFPRRAGQQLGHRRPLHERPRVHHGADRARRRDLSGHERSAQPDLAAVLPLRDGQAVRPSRPARLGERGRPRAAAEGRRTAACCWATRCSPTGGRAPSAAPRACALYYDVHPSLDSTLTLDPAAKNSLRRSAAEDRAPARCGDRGAAARHQGAHLRTSSRSSRARTTARSCRRARAAISIIPAGGCRMGADPATSVCDSFGRTHDHANLFVVGVADAADWRLHQRHADVCRAHVAIGERGGHDVGAVRR